MCITARQLRAEGHSTLGKLQILAATTHAEADWVAVTIFPGLSGTALALTRELCSHAQAGQLRNAYDKQSVNKGTWGCDNTSPIWVLL